jgi:hypothetical protein
MTRKLKRPDGAVIEEYITSSWHIFEDGRLLCHDNDASDGRYTGRFRFRHTDGRLTRWYTERSAPQWLRALWLEATGARG